MSKIKSRTSSIVDAMDDTALLHEVREIRRQLPRVGVRKLKVMLYQRGLTRGATGCSACSRTQAC